MKTPFFDFLNKIAVDDDALKRFVTDPDHSPEASGLDKAQKAAVLEQNIPAIYDLLLKENPKIQDDLDSGRVVSPAFDPIPPVGWNMKHFKKRVGDAQNGNHGNHP
jgi:hypothetical protein